MKILAIESSAAPASCAVMEDGRLLATVGAHTGLDPQPDALIPMVDSMLKKRGDLF